MSEPLPSAPIASLIETVVDDYGDELVAMRRDLHAHPELSWREVRTTALVGDRVRPRGGGSPSCRASGLIAELGDAGP